MYLYTQLFPSKNKSSYPHLVFYTGTFFSKIVFKKMIACANFSLEFKFVKLKKILLLEYYYNMLHYYPPLWANYSIFNGHLYYLLSLFEHCIYCYTII